MKILVTGANGQLGYDVIKEVNSRGHCSVGVDIAQMDITNFGAVKKVISIENPDAVIHCAAYTAVDAAEYNKELCQAVNAIGTGNVAKVCRELNIKLMYISTDYVFDGNGTNAWKPDCKDYSPLNVYGKSKLDGEFAVERLKKYFIVRISWVFGINGNNFVKTMLSLGKKHESVKVVNDQIGTPTYTKDLAKLLVDIIETEKYGCYHATNEGGYISWYDFACEIFKQVGYKTKVFPVATEEYGISKAKRPYNSRLDKGKLTENGFSRLPDWKDALNRYLKEISI